MRTHGSSSAPVLRSSKGAKNGFTLVELIVVITILAILGTIGFLSLQGYSRSARDSERTTDLTNIGKGFDVLSAAGKLFPRPDASMLTITASGTTIGYQGYAGKNVISALSLGGKFQDPIDTQYYTYETNLSQNKYQILGLLEDGGNISLTMNEIPGVDTAYAGTYDTRYPLSKGASLGVLLGTGAILNQPVQELYAVGTFTGVDVLNTTGNYVLQYNNKTKVSGTGAALGYGYLTYASNIGLVGYWDMETMVSDGSLADLSDTKDNGAPNGGMTFGGINGKIGKATSFNGTGNYVNMGYSSKHSFTGNFTLSAWIYPTAFHTVGYFGLKNQFIGCGPATTYNYEVQATDAGTISFVKRTGSEGLQYYDFTGIPSMANKWTQVTLTVANGNLQLYVNGTLFGTVPVGPIAPGPNNDNLLIGGTLGGSGTEQEPLFQGSIDEVRIYNRALSVTEITALYNATK